MKLTEQDKRILREIQQDTSPSLSALADKVEMAQSTVWRKLQDLDAAGVIVGRKAVLDSQAVDAGFCVFANVSLADHSETAVADFASIVHRQPEIMECHALTGASDYVLKIRVSDVSEYEQFMTHYLLRNPHIRTVESSISLKEIKSTTEMSF